jgi:hypothetical protein
MPEIDSSALFDHALKLYEAMNDQADKDGIYEGKVTDTFSKLGISMTYYTPLFNALKELGCIEMLERGTRARPTRYRLHGSPKRKAFDTIYLTNVPRRATLPLESLEQRLSNLERRLDGLDIKAILLEQEKRLQKLEGGS